MSIDAKLMTLYMQYEKIEEKYLYLSTGNHNEIDFRNLIFSIENSVQDFSNLLIELDNFRVGKKTIVNLKRKIMIVIQDLEEKRTKIMNMLKQGPISHPKLTSARIEGGDDHLKIRSQSNTPEQVKTEQNLADYQQFNILFPKKNKKTFKDYAGLPKIKKIIKENYFWQKEFPDEIEEFNIESIKGFFLYGPPGTGKSFFVKCIAGEFKLPLISFDASNIMDKYVGESPKKVKKLFQCADELKPCIIFIDEVDKILPNSTDGSNSSKGDITQELLTNLNERDPNIMVIFATNEPQKVNEALFRPGRIDVSGILYVGPPSKTAIKWLLDIYLRKKSGGKVPRDFEIEDILSPFLEYEKNPESGMYSAAAVENIALIARKRYVRLLTKSKTANKKGTPVILSKKMFLSSVQDAPFDITQKSLKNYREFAQTRGTKVD